MESGLSVTEAVLRWGRSERAIRRDIDRGVIAADDADGMLRIPADEVERVDAERDAVDAQTIEEAARRIVERARARISPDGGSRLRALLAEILAQVVADEATRYAREAF